MSMSLRFHSVSDKDIRDIEDVPLRLEILHYGELLDSYILEEMDEDESQQILNWKPTTTPEIFYVDGAFQTIHYLLTKPDIHKRLRFHIYT